MNKYILDDQGRPVRCLDLMEWARWYETARRHVAVSDLGELGRVSTVFLSLDHNFGTGAPILWETMVFGGPNNGEMRRYTSREAAELGHAEMVKMCEETGIERVSPLDAKPGGNPPREVRADYP